MFPVDTLFYLHLFNSVYYANTLGQQFRMFLINFTLIIPGVNIKRDINSVFMCSVVILRQVFAHFYIYTLSHLMYKILFHILCQHIITHIVSTYYYIFCIHTQIITHIVSKHYLSLYIVYIFQKLDPVWCLMMPNYTLNSL